MFQMNSTLMKRGGRSCERLGRAAAQGGRDTATQTLFQIWGRHSIGRDDTWTTSEVCATKSPSHLSTSCRNAASARCHFRQESSGRAGQLVPFIDRTFVCTGMCCWWSYFGRRQLQDSSSNTPAVRTSWGSTCPSRGSPHSWAGSLRPLLLLSLELPWTPCAGLKFEICAILVSV